MKKALIVFLLYSISTLCSSQASLNVLEDAYINFDNGKFKKAVKSFETYFTVTKGSSLDYYFYMASLAKTGKKKEVLDLMEHHCDGIEFLGMMISDNHFSSVHNELKSYMQSLDGFYDYFNHTRFHNNESALKKLDSLYRQLPLKKVTAVDLFEISKYYKRLNDSTMLAYYLHEAIVNGNPNTLAKKRISDNIVNYVIAYPNQMSSYFPSYMDAKLYREKSFIHGMNQKNDSMAISLESLIQNVDPIFILADDLYNAACANSLIGNYEKAGNYLIQSINAGFTDLQHLFQDIDLKPLFNSDEGQLTLKYLFSRYYESAFLEADGIFESQSVTYSRSKNLTYEYLKANQFNAQIPRLFEIYKNATGEIHMPNFWQDNKIQDTSFEYVFEYDANDKISVREPGLESGRIILYNRTANDSYVNFSGLCYNYPLENKEFFNRIRVNGTTLNVIPSIQNKYYTPLIKAAYKAKLKTKVKTDDETFLFALKMGIQYLPESLLNLLQNQEPLELEYTLDFIDNSLHHTALFDLAPKIISDTAYIDKLSLEDKSELSSIVFQYSNNLPYRALKGDSKKLTSPKSNANWRDHSTYFSHASYAISRWWSTYKKENPFPIPNLKLKTNGTVTKVDKNLGMFYLDKKSDGPIFYNNVNRRIEFSGQIKRLPTNSYLNTTINENTAYVFAPSHHTNPHRLSVIDKLNDVELEKLHNIVNTLGLKSKEQVQTKTGFNMIYDQFYPYSAFEDLILFWHQDNQIFYNSFKAQTKDENSKKLLAGAMEKTCFGDETKYIETSYLLNSLKAIQKGDYLYVLYNIKTKEKPSCRNTYYQNTALLKINKELEIVSSVDIPGKYFYDYKPSPNPTVELKITEDRIFAIIWPDGGGPGKGYYTTFDLNLEPTSEIITISETIGDKRLFSNTAITSINFNNEIYVAYPSREDEEIYLKIQHLTKEGNDNKTAYLLKPEIVLLHQELVTRKNGDLFYYYMTKKDGENFFFEVPLNLNEIFD